MFIPNGLGIISHKRTAEDAHLSGTNSFLKQPEKAVQLQMQDYAAVLYDEHWWIGLVETIDKIFSEAKMKFMTPHGPQKTFYWPAREDTC